MRNADCLGQHPWRSPDSAIAIEFWVGQIKPCPISLCLLFQYCVISEIKFKCTSCVALMMQTYSPGLTYLALVKRECMTWGQTELGPNSSFPLWFWTITSPTELPITLQYSESNTAPDRYKRKTKPETKNKTKTKYQRLFFINFWQEHPSAVLSFLHGFKDIRKKSKF